LGVSFGTREGFVIIYVHLPPKSYTLSTAHCLEVSVFTLNDYRAPVSKGGGANVQAFITQENGSDIMFLTILCLTYESSLTNVFVVSTLCLSTVGLLSV
jgi:hypothetical protein